jgi:DNA replicative helicase MCM subunit Mcm2 (Cdc46/Mcm family)
MREEKDQRSVATLIFSKYKENHAATKPKYDNELVKKYIGYARKNIRPQINEDVEQMITENFINLTKPSSTTEEQAFFSTRLLTNIIRLSVAVAKARLSNEISISDDAFMNKLQELNSQ